MRKPLIAGNWKMYKTINEALELVTGLKRNLADSLHVDILVCPTFVALSPVYDLLVESNIELGAQNVYWEKEGAYTGEISPIMLKDAGCEYVIIGHSERRKYFGETEVTVNKRLKAVLEIGLKPICCVGETLEEREADKTIEIIETQLKGAFAGIDGQQMLDVTIAYEPVWAIGTGKTATPGQAQEVHKFIRDWLTTNYSDGLSKALRILYGGSVKPENTKDLMSQEDIDGALVGGAALKVDSFTKIVQNAVPVVSDAL